MNKKPVSYLQTDPRWANADYSAVGEKTNIKESGCGPTAAAMLIETLTGKAFTPKDACKWSLEHGYKAPHQGTYYSYFRPQFAAFGIDCDQLNWVNTYGKPDSENHAKAFKLLREGYYLIALMGKGLWTSSGHFVVLWWEDGKVRINDPASTKAARLNGDLRTFCSQAKYYWWVDARHYNKEDEDMTKDEVSKMIEAAKPKAYTSVEECPPWAQPLVQRALNEDVLKGDGAGKLHLTDDNLVNLQMMYNMADRAGK